MNYVSSFSFTEDKKPIVDEFAKIADRERKGRSRVLIQLMEEYVKVHSEGNPAFTLDQFQDQNFRAMPATMSPIKDWKEFINHNTDEKEDRTLELKCLGIIGAIKDKRNAKISNSS